MFDKFCDLLLQYNKTHNISGVKTKEDIYRYIEDSLYPKKFLEDKKSILDVGSGAGFPGLVIAMAYPDKSVALFEPIKKKSAFLHLAKTVLGLKNVTVYSKRIEECDSFFVDLIVSRAVGEVGLLLQISKKFITKDTHLLLYKGSSVEKELSKSIKYDMIQNKNRKYIYIKAIQ